MVLSEATVLFFFILMQISRLHKHSVGTAGFFSFFLSKLYVCLKMNGSSRKLENYDCVTSSDLVLTLAFISCYSKWTRS